MNTKVTPQGQSRKASVTPCYGQSQRNGHLPHGRVSLKKTPNQKKSESTDTFEMQAVSNLRPTLEAFDELEHLVPSDVPGQAAIVEMSSLLYDQDDESSDAPTTGKSTVTQRSNQSWFDRCWRTLRIPLVISFIIRLTLLHWLYSTEKNLPSALCRWTNCTYA